MVANVTGVIDETFGLYRVQPTALATYTAANLRPAAPEPVGGRFQVGAFNTLNYFLTLDTTASSSTGPCGANGDLDCRGADDAGEFDRQRAKLLEAISGLNTEVLGLIELENTPGVEPLAAIVAGLNARLGAGTYSYIDTGVIGTDAIRVGIIYQSTVVTPVGPFASLNTSVDPRFIDTRNRPTLAQTFAENATGARFTVAVNHLKSKGSSCGAGDDDPQQGNCNATRTQAAAALTDWLASDPTGSGDPDFLIVGDLNAYAKEDPIDTLKAGADDTTGSDDYTNLIETSQGRFAYSYVFDARLGYLDYALSGAALTPQVTGATEWHLNADEPDVLDYDNSFKPPEQEALYEPNAYRTADHDPVVVGLNLSFTAPEPVADRYQIDFETAPANRTIYNVRVGSGVVYLGGDGTASTGTIPVVGKRRVGNRILQGQQAKVVSIYGSKRLIISAPSRTTPAPTSGRIKLSFAPNIAPEGVTLTSLTLSNLPTAGAYLTFYYVDGTSSRQNVAGTGTGDTTVVPVNAVRVRAVDIFAPSAYAVDDVTFTDQSTAN